jgi:hypothetical protein
VRELGGSSLICSTKIFSKNNFNKLPFLKEEMPLPPSLQTQGWKDLLEQEEIVSASKGRNW